MTNETYNRLKKFERTLTTAYRANYVISLSYRDSDELTSIYNETYHQSKKTSRCTKCLLEVAKRLGKDYFDYQAKIEAVTLNEETPVAETPVTEQPKPKKKRTASKKKKGGK